ncbi:MAG TPA: hypothetical protein PK636_09060, partial [bacterium]|nr:hypothetical protein [bacterium]
VEGSVEPDKRRTVVHVWKRARKTTRHRMYQARRAYLKNNLSRCARFLGIVSHFITDGMVHGNMDRFSHSEDHSTVEGDIGARSDFTAKPADTIGEGIIDGEFAFQEIDALVKEGLSPLTLNRALSVLGGAVLSPAAPPPQVVKSNANFTARIRGPFFRAAGGAALLAAAGGGAYFSDPLWAVLAPFGLLAAGNAFCFRILASWGWAAAGAAALGFVYTLDEAPQWSRLRFTPDLARWAVRWYNMPETAGKPGKGAEG